MGNFEFLRVYWPTLAEMGKAAEVYVYTDPNSCIYKLGQMSELMVREILNTENINVQNGSTHQVNIEVLKRTGLISNEVNDFLFSIRKARNAAVHSGIQSQEKAMTLLKMTFSLMSWFMEVYGDWEFESPEFAEPIRENSEIDNISIRIEEQEERIKELLLKIENVTTAASNMSLDDKVEKVKDLGSHLSRDKVIDQYLEDEKVRVETSILPTINYALQQNGISFIRDLVVVNNRTEDLENVVLEISTNPDYTEKIEYSIANLPAQSRVNLSDIRLNVDVNKMVELSERVNVTLSVSLRQDAINLFDEKLALSALPFDQWQGINFMPELLVSYVMPNHPDVSKVITKASDILKEWGEDSSLEGYQAHSTKRVRDQISAIFAAIKSLNLVYTNPPASFSTVGQRIRLIDQIFEERIGTCLDLTLFMASTLEAIGLNPILITQPGHIFLGVWLEDLTFPEMVLEDDSSISKRVAKGLNEIILIESTLLTSNSDQGFDEAVSSALHSFESKGLVHIIDVKRARLTRILPLPIRVRDRNGIHSIVQDRVYTGIAKKSKYDTDQVILDNITSEPSDKIDQWERRLLDLTLRNNLINMRLTKGTIPLLINSLDNFEDALASGKVFNIYSKPVEWHTKQEALNFENSNDLGNFEQMIEQEIEKKRLRAFLPELELDNRLKNLYRSARLSFEENGANTLFLTFGLMKWYESDKADKPRFAPIILVPVELKRRAASHSYTVELRDEESQMNITLLEKMKQDFGIEINGLNPLPMDDDGIDIRMVFTIIRNAIKNQKRWDLIESNFMGVFSFSQFVMWNDLRNRTEDLKKNKIVHSLIESKLTFEPKYSSGLSYEEIEDKVLQPLPADASQLVAIQNSIDGKSFVLHGPPGTGKSQTITSLIANNLFQGRTVLFVAEKRAALDVVQKRLSDIGLGDFTLELHSNKTNKKEVLSHFENLTKLVNTRSVESFDYHVEEASKNRLELNSYARALREVHSNDFTIFELISEYEEFKNADELPKFSTEDLQSFNKKMKYEQERFIGQLVDSAQQIGHPHNHPLTSVELLEYTQTLRDDVRDAVEAYRIGRVQFEKSLSNIQSTIDFEFDVSQKSLTEVELLLEQLFVWEKLPYSWKIEENLNFQLTEVKKLIEETQKELKQEFELLQNWNEEFLMYNGFELWEKITIVQDKWFLAKFLGMRRIKKSISESHIEGIIDENVLINDVIKLAKYQEQKQVVKDLFTSYGSYLGDEYRGKETDWEHILSMIESATVSSNIMKEMTGSHRFRINNSVNNNLYGISREFLEDIHSFIPKYDTLVTLLKLAIKEESNRFEEVELIIRNVEANIMILKEWVLWNEMKVRADEFKLNNIIAAYESGAKHDEILSIFKKTYTHQLSSLMISQVPVLNMFNGSLFNAKIKQFKELDRKISELSKIELRYKLVSELPDFNLASIGKSEIAILKRAIQSKGRGMTVRRLFSEIPNLLFKLAPVMLMSPMSAAQYLDPSHPQFDLVVFDEASQLPTAKAVGTIARAKNAVIVGDPKQMPPTSFFASTKIDEDNIELEDLESVLDDAIAISLPEEHLQWHYRSKHESLISFSNSEFYKNVLYTFPSANDLSKRVSMKYVNGVFDRGRRRYNEVEAQAVVSYLYELYQDAKQNHFSVGIVTFNSNQQNLIEDLIVAKTIQDPLFDNWVNNVSEPVFIKNLENVQGDERDIILFSIGYGPDQDGKTYMNFGPLNRVGGWRRLNVAITRSRYEMIVFSSLYPEDIDMNRTSAEGVASLKKFLEFALNNSNLKELNKEDKTINSQQQYGVANSIAKEFTRLGYNVKLNVGKSSFKVDVAIIDKNNPDEFLLGILLDGESYQSAKTTRDREISHQSVLEGLDWSIIRVWSLDWRENPKREFLRIKNYIKTLKLGNKPVEHKSQSVFKSIETEEVASKSLYEAVPYKTYKAHRSPKTVDDFTSSYGNQSVEEDFIKLIQTEAPIYTDVAYRKILNIYGITRLTQRSINRLNSLVKKNGIYVQEEDKNTESTRTVLWVNEEQKDNRSIFRRQTVSTPRTISDTPLVELANTMSFVLKNYISLSETDLIRETANLLGTNTISSKVRAQMQGTIIFARAHGYILKTEDGSYRNA